MRESLPTTLAEASDIAKISGRFSATSQARPGSILEEATFVERHIERE